MEIKPSESSDKTNADVGQKDTQGTDKLSLSVEDKVEEQGQPSESLSNDVGFKKVFKLVGFKFTVRKDKTEKVEPVQLLNVKADDEAEMTSGEGGDCKEVKTETVDEAAQSEVLCSVERTEQETQTDQKKEESLPETVTESPLEEGSKQEEVKNEDSRSPESPTSPLTTETASPLRKFFTQGWAGFRKKTSFRKPKEDEQQAVEKDKQEQVKEVAKEESAISEELEKEKPVPEAGQMEISMEVSDAKVEKGREEREETKMVDVSTETHDEDAVIPHEQPPAKESAEPEIKEPEISVKEKTVLTSEEESTQTEECLVALEQSTPAPPEKEPETTALLTGEASEGKTDPSGLTSPMAIEKIEEPFEIIEADRSEPEAPVVTEILEEKSREMSTDSSTTEKKEEPKTTPKEELVLEKLVETVAESESGQSAEKQLTVKEASSEDVSEHLKQTEPNTVTAATSQHPEGVTSEAELFSSQERAKIQGSPLKKLFTSSSLKKLSGKKRKGKKEAAKSGEAGEQMQQYSDSAESPEDPRGESSASSPEEATESVEKADASQITEPEEGSALDVEKKRESVTPWASFKKMVTPKKRVRRLSESDKEDELDKAKTTTLSSTESGPSEEQEEMKENAEEQKLEKSTEEPKRKVDTSVSWEALICVGSSKKRSRKSSSSDEEVGQRLAQDGQKIDEGVVPNKDVAAEVTLTSSQESDQGQGNSSPEQVGSPSEGEGVSTWESFKRLVTPRRKSKTRMEDKSEDVATVPSLEHSTSDTDSGREESWVSFKKLMPGRRKKKSDGVPEHAPVQESGEEMAETNEEDYDVPAVVPLSEYEAAEQEKFEAQRAKQDHKAEKDLEEEKEKPEDSIKEQSNEGLMHAVTVTVVEGERAVTSIEERSPSWISAAVTESIEQANEDEERIIEPISETGVVEETVVDTKLMPEIKKDISRDTVVSELTSEAITAREEPSGVDEGTEMSCAEETTEMVSAVSRLSESPDTTEIATPVQEVEENQQNLEELNKQTEEILQEVAERVRVTEEASVVCESLSEAVVQPVSVVKPAVAIQGVELPEMPLKEEEAEKSDLQTDGGMKTDEGQVEVKKGDLKEVLEQQKDVCMEVPGSTELTSSLDRTDESDSPKTEQEVVGESEKKIEKQMVDEKSDDEEEFVIVTVMTEEGQKVTDGDTTEKQNVLLKEMENGEYGPASVVQEVKMNVEAATPVMTIDAPKVDESIKVTHEEKPQFSPKQEKLVDIIPDLKSQPTEHSTIEVKESLLQNELQDANILTESPRAEELVPETPTQSKIIEVPVMGEETKVQDVDEAREAVLGAKTGDVEEVAVEPSTQSKDTDASVKNLETEVHVQKMEPESWQQTMETNISVKDNKSESFLVKLEEQVHGEIVETEVPIRKLEVDVLKQKAVAEDHVQRMVTSGHLKEIEKKSDIQSTEEIVVLKPEVTDMETKTECIVEKTDVPEHQVAEPHITTVEGVHSVLAVDMKEVAKTTGVVSEALAEKDEVEPLVEALTKVTGAMMDMEAVTEKASAEVEMVTATEEVASKIDVKASTEEVDTQVEGMIPENMVTSSGQAGGKLEKEVPEAVVDIESSVETSGAEVAEKKSEMEVPPENTDMDHSAEEVKVVSSLEKSEAEIRTEKTKPEIPTEETGVKTGEEITAEKTDAEVAVKDPEEKVDEKGPAEQSEEVLVKAEVTAEQLEKEALEEVQEEIGFQTDVESAASSLVMSVEPVSAEVSRDIISTEEELVRNAMTQAPLQTEVPGVAISLESKASDAVATVTLSESEVKDGAPALVEVATVQTGTEAPEERGLDEPSVSKEDTVDLTQAVVGDARPILKSQIPERIKVDAAESKDKVIVKDVILVETKSDKESIIQREIPIPHIKTEEEPLTFRDTNDSEGHVQSEKEDAFSLEPGYTKAAGDIVQREAAGDTTKIELGKEHLATELEPTKLVTLETVVEGSILSDSGYLKSDVPNAVLESKSDSAPLESTEVSQNGISAPTETCPDKLPLEAVPPVLEHTATSDSYQTKQGLSEKVQIVEEQKSSDNIESASGDVCHSTSVQQEVSTEQQAAVSISIPEAPSCTVCKSSVTVTAAEVQEQIIAENVVPAEPSNETLPPSPEEQRETEFRLVQQVSFAHSVCGVVDPDAEIVSKKIVSTLEEPVSPTVSSTKDDLLQKSVSHPIPEMKHQKPETTSQEAGKKTTPPDRSPSLTHIEFQKDVVQSVTIESQSTKIVLKIIQNAVDRLEETEEPGSVTKQQSDSHLVGADQSETQTGLQPLVKGEEERSQEMQASSITQPAEKQYAFKTVEEKPLHPEKSGSEESVDSIKISTKPKAVDEQQCTITTLEEHPGFPSEVTKEIIKEKGLQQENGEPKDLVVSAETQRAILEGFVSVDVPKESLELDPPKLKDIEVGQATQIQEQLSSEQQTHVKRKGQGPLTEIVERDVNNQDCTSCKSPQLKSELAES